MPARTGTGRIPIGVLVALALAILLAGFLLGRRSSPVETPAPSSPPPTLPPSTVPVTVPADEPPPTLAAAPPTLAAEFPPLSVPASPPTEAPAPAHAGVNEEITRYFAEADAIQARAKYWSDPQALARTILEQAAGGNPGAFDDLIRSQTSARGELERLTVPAACAEHHRRSLAVMREGIGLLELVRGALQSSDMNALDGLQERASALEREAKEVDELGRKLQQR